MKHPQQCRGRADIPDRCGLATSACVALLITATASAALAGDDEKLAREQAEEHLARGDAQAAVDLLARVPSTGADDLSCIRGSAYHELGDLPRAYLHLERCRRLGSQESHRLRMGKVRTQLRAGEFAPVTLVVTPDSARIEIQPTLTGETITPADSVWLPYGTHQVSARAPDHDVAVATVEVTSVERMLVTLHLPKSASPTGSTVDFGDDPGQELGTVSTVNDPSPLEHKPLLPDRFTRKQNAAGPRLSDEENDRHDAPTAKDPWPWVTLGAGGAALAAAAVMHYRAASTDDDAGYRRDRNWAIGLYSAGAALAGAGVYLLLRTPEPAPSVALAPKAGGASLGLSWRF